MNKPIDIRNPKDFENLSSAEIKNLISERNRRFDRNPHTEDDYNNYLNDVIYAYYHGAVNFECRQGCVFAQKVCDIALKRQINAEVKFYGDRYSTYCYIVLNFNW